MEPIELEDLKRPRKKSSVVPMLFAVLLGALTSYGLYYLIEDILIGDREPVIVSKNSGNREVDRSQTEDSNPPEQPGEGGNAGQIAGNGNFPTGTIDDPNVDGFAIAPFDDEQAAAYQKDWAGRLGIPVESTNSVGMKFVLVPPGEFLMGSEEFDDEEKPPHPARLTTAYELGMFEVTQEQYEAVVGMNPSQFEGEKLPVEQVSWDQAAAFCRLLSERPAEQAAGYKYRLPTEAEWEFACRAGTATKFSGGDTSAQLEEDAFYLDNSNGITQPVGQKSPNSWGLYDMHGNVWEWCRDWFGDYAQGAVTDPQGPSSGVYRVRRGGAFDGNSNSCRSSKRGVSRPDSLSSNLGFRVLRERSPLLADVDPKPQSEPQQSATGEMKPQATTTEVDEDFFRGLAKAGPFSGRSGENRQVLLKTEGGTEESEKAVELALKWIADQQLPDGSWSFAQIGDSPNGGVFANCQMGATGLALMAFLGAGHTHLDDGPYKETVADGLEYLKKNARVTPNGTDYRAPSNEGNMYVQGICVIALAEASAMTRDRRLHRFVKGGVELIVKAQNPRGGGWRYSPREKGDTSVLGWQVYALTTAYHAGIDCPETTLEGAYAYLDRVQLLEGNYTWYGYMKPERKYTTSAVGLLSRLYLGWKRDNSLLKKGIKTLEDHGRSLNNEYYDYYATQVMHHWGGQQWLDWNSETRERLIRTQNQDEGPSKGSWKPSFGQDGSQAGRLYSTCLNVMTLEVYYRHLPLYRIEEFD